ncbi:MAG: metallophosphoesterase [Hyphomicrobium sp.]
MTGHLLENAKHPDRRGLNGPFDIIGDVHGCAEELIELMDRLGYGVRFAGRGEDRHAVTTAPEGRRAVFAGDFVDRGPNSPDVLRVVMAMVNARQALAVEGNHDVKFLRWLAGRQLNLSHGLDRTVGQFKGEHPAFHGAVKQFLSNLPSHLWLDGGQLAVAHAGIRHDMLGRDSGDVRHFCLYGDTGSKSGQDGLPVRYHWAASYEGATAIVYGHTPVPEAEWVNNTLCIDTGCCFGGKLTALRWPERTLTSVGAQAAYTPSLRPFGHPPVRPVAPQ